MLVKLHVGICTYARTLAWIRRVSICTYTGETARRNSSDDVGQQLAFEAAQKVLECQLTPLQTLHLDRVEGHAFLKSADILVERAVLGLELNDPGLDRFDLEVHRGSETLPRKNDLV